MKLTLQKRLAADLLKVGESRIWINPAESEEISKAITKTDIKGLIAQGLIKLKPKIGVSRGRAKKLAEQRKKGRRKGHGRRKGTKKARTSKKRTWINKIRPLRKMLKAYKAAGKINSKNYQELYSKSKGNFFRNKTHLKSYLDKMEGK